MIIELNDSPGNAILVNTTHLEYAKETRTWIGNGRVSTELGFVDGSKVHVRQDPAEIAQIISGKVSQKVVI